MFTLILKQLTPWSDSMHIARDCLRAGLVDAADRTMDDLRITHVGTKKEEHATGAVSCSPPSLTWVGLLLFVTLVELYL